jgi:hypothetical protein
MGSVGAVKCAAMNPDSVLGTASTTITAYSSIRVGLFPGIGVRTSEDIVATLNELVSLSGKLGVDLYEGPSFPLQFDVAGPPDFFPDCPDIPQEDSLRKFDVVLRVITHGEHPVHEWFQQDGSPATNVPYGEKLKHAKEAFADDVRDRLFEVTLACNLSRPGVLTPSEGAIFIDGARYKTFDPIVTPLDEALLETKNIGWPQIDEIPLIKIWEWLQSVPGFKKGVATTDLGRAIAAFSYLFSRSFDAESPFHRGLWAILGLEAIYGEGNELLARQLVEKTNAFLGKQKTHLRALNNMYSFRSRFLHGDIDFPYAHRQLDAAEEVDKFYDGATLPEFLAMRVLTATLQKMAAEKRYHLGFRTEVLPQMGRLNRN